MNNSVPSLPRPRPLPRVALIAGPTASGKSALAIAVAERHDGVVVNADSAQVYADLRILTARPAVADEARVPHRLFGHVDAADTGYSAARWAAEAHAAVAAILADGRLPVVVGGTGLYLRTLIDGIAPVPPVDPGVRATVRALPVAQAHAALAREDPAAAARLSPADTTRVARALEVVRSSGRSLLAWQAKRTGGLGATVDLRAGILLPPRDRLAMHIDARAAAMLPDAVAEVERLRGRADIPADAPILRAIGVGEIAALLDRRATRDETLQALALATRRYAKRQYTWFRNQPPPEWKRFAEAADLETFLQ